MTNDGKRVAFSHYMFYRYIRVEFNDFYNSTSLPLLYRLRSYPGDASASGLHEVIGTCTQRPKYSSGYGIMGNQYIFRIQTDSSSIQGGAWTSGIWVP